MQAVRWRGPGPELAISLDRDTDEPLGHQLQEQLREGVRRGTLRVGERLPSSRRLAEQLGVSRGLVVECFEQLHAEGYLESVVGSGTRVAAGVGAVRTEDPPPRVPTASTPPARIDFEYGIPDLASFPLRDWLWALGEAARTAPAALLGDETDAGSPHLRDVLTAYHRRVRAGCAEPEDAIIVGGFRQGLAFTLAALARQGLGRIALEDPGPRDHDRMARRAGLEVVAVPVDDQGIDVTALRASGARAVLLTPAHQCPTGAVLAPHRRHDLLDWAEEVDGIVLEDDYDAEFRYDRQPVGSLQGLAQDRVIALGSVSKTLAPGIRIGWLLVPPRFAPAVLEEKLLASRGVPSLDQVALARLVESGRFDRHLRRTREIYRSRRDALAEAVGTHLPGLPLEGMEAGCHSVLRLPDGADEAALAAEARNRSVAVRGIGDYRVAAGPAHGHGTAGSPSPRPPGLLLGFGNLNESRIREGIRILAEVVEGSRR